MSEHNQHHQHTGNPVPAPVAPTPAPNPPKKAAPDLTKVTPYKVTRNEIEKALTPFAGKRGNWDGVVYQAPQISEDGFDKDITWFGRQNIIRTINIVSRRMAQDYHDDAIPETGDQAGIFNVTTFLNSVENWSAAALKLSELRELHDEAVDKVMSAQTELMDRVIAANGDTYKINEVKKWFKGLTDQVNSYKAEIADRSARRSKEAAGETVAPE